MDGESVAVGDLTPAVLEASGEAFVAIGSDGIVCAWNPAAVEMFGWEKDEAVGRRLEDLVVPDRNRAAYRDRLRQGLAGGAAGSPILGRRLELTAIRRDRAEVPVEFTVSEIDLPGGAAFGALVRDVSEPREAERELGHLAALIESSSDAIMSSTPDGIVLTWNGGAETLFGYRADEIIGRPMTDLIPEESQPAAEEIRRRLLADEPIHEFKTRIRHLDGTIVDVTISLATVRDDQGETTGLSAIARDISERVASRRALHELRSRLAGAFENAPIGMALVATDGRFIAVNRTLCELLERPAPDLIGTEFQAITHPEDLDADMQHVTKVLAGDVPSYEMEKRYLLPGGGHVWGQLCVSLVRDEQGNPLHFVSQIQDITARKESEADLRRRAERLDDLALKDALTGLTNYHEFCSVLEREVERARRYRHDLSLILLDVDRFGEINSELGRAKGDDVLRQIAVTLAEVPRLPDLAARIADDEFALLLPHTDQAGARVVADRITAEAASIEELGLTMSVGLSSFRRRGEVDTAQDILVRAEADLRAAKSVKSPDSETREGALRPRARTAIERVLALARHQLDMDLALLSEFVDGQAVYRALEGDSKSFGVDDGDAVELADTYCQRLIAGESDGLIRNAATERSVRDLALTTEAGIGSYAGVPIRLSDGRVFGTLCSVSHGPKPALGERDRELLAFLSEVIGTTLEQDMVEVTERQTAVELSGVHALVAALEARDEYTSEHSKTVVALAVEVACLLELTPEQILEVEQIAILHDIGKVGIPDSVLQKPGPLSADEWALMRQHPAIGERVIAATQSLAHLAPAIRAEHERFDGDGYPDGLRGPAIPVASRITLACDAYHAMRSDRPYRAAMSMEDARAELVRCSGSQFDPNVIDTLLAVIDRQGTAAESGRAPGA